MAKILNIHILGLAGVMTAPLAQALIKLGHKVTGSDQQNIYPPISNLISNIPLNQPLGAIDLVIVGSSYKSFKICQEQFIEIKKKNIPYISATQYLAQNLIKKESILVAGSYGKTTTTALLAWLMPSANYFFGGTAIDNFPSINLSDSQWSIVEADESINGLDQQAKFLYYPVKYLILTSAQWEHKESYKSVEDNFQAYKKLIQNIPPDGLLIYNPTDADIQKLLPYCKAKTIHYEKKVFDTKLIGQHNQQNISAVFTLSKYLNIPFDISRFSGIRRRLEIISDKDDILIIDDFAQSADRVKSALEAVKFSYPHRRIVIYFEPHATFLRNQQSLQPFKFITDFCDEFILGKIIFSPDIKPRVTAKDWQNIIGSQMKYLPLYDDVLHYLKQSLHPRDILIHFSSGGLDGLNTLKKVYNN
ncbi:MAG: Mur ligase family protein [Microgenomates group bacterium]